MAPDVHAKLCRLAKFAFGKELDSVSSIGEAVGRSGAERIRGAFNDLAKALSTTVILQAGDVFMFQGMTTEKDHNVFTTITYNTPTEGSA